MADKDGLMLGGAEERARALVSRAVVARALTREEAHRLTRMQELSAEALARLAAAENITIEQAMQRLQVLFQQRHGGTPADALKERSLAWLAEDRAALQAAHEERERAMLERLLRSAPAPRTDRQDGDEPGAPAGGAVPGRRRGRPSGVRNHPLVGMPAGLTANRARLLDWLRLGATNAEIAALETLSPHTVHKTLHEVYQRLHVRSRKGAAVAWRDLCRRSGRPIDPTLAPRLALLRGQAGDTVAVAASHEELPRVI